MSIVINFLLRNSFFVQFKYISMSVNVGKLSMVSGDFIPFFKQLFLTLFKKRLILTKLILNFFKLKRQI